METATVISGAVAVAEWYYMEGVLYLSVAMRSGDYEEFVTLPAALEFDGLVCGRSCWNSDTHRAWYRSNQPVAIAKPGVSFRIKLDA